VVFTESKDALSYSAIGANFSICGPIAATETLQGPAWVVLDDATSEHHSYRLAAGLVT
jgi:hypothetical protein